VSADHRDQPDHADPSFPALHGRPARGWLNDPNGLALVDGRYHVFFQHNADDPLHHRISWGHVSSADLVTWREEPLALVAREGRPDAYGCWTGCVVVDDGVPTAVYSAVAAGPGGRAEVLLARGSADLRTWDQGSTPVVALPDDPDVTEVRDPFVFHAGGHRYAVQGAGREGGTPRILVYGCDDLERWEPLGTLLDGTDPVAWRVAPAEVWECPNLVPLGEVWVLVVSLWRRRGEGRSTLDGVRYLVGGLDLTDEGPRFRPTGGGELDAGEAFYAPQLLVTDDRVLLWGWAKEEDRPEADVLAAGWSGALTFPRELVVDDGAVVTRPVPELEALRAEATDVGDPLSHRSFEVVHRGAGGCLVLVDDAGETEVHRWSTGTRVLVDGSVVEAYPVDGVGVPVTLRAYPGAGSRWELRTDGGEVSAWRLAVP
jgi:beta-fructofuranosidase